MKWTSWVVAAAATLSIGTAAYAQGATGFPSKPIKVMVPLSPGGGVDTVTRKLAEKLSAQMGKPLIVENKPGAAGTLGIERRRSRRPTATRWC